MKEYLIDTNIFLRFLVRDDEKSAEDCRRFLQLVRLGKIKAFTTTINIIEMGWTLNSYYKLNKAQVLKALRGVINLRGLEIRDGYDLRSALSLWEQENIKFVDAIISSLDGKDAKVVSYDKDFDRTKMQRVEPHDVLSLYS